MRRTLPDAAEGPVGQGRERPADRAGPGSGTGTRADRPGPERARRSRDGRPGSGGPGR